MRVLVGFFVMAVMLAMPFQVSAQEMTKQEVAKIEAEGLAVMEANIDGWRQGAIDQIMEAWHPTATSWVIGSVPRDFAYVRDWATGLFVGEYNWEGGWVETTVQVLTPDAAVFQGRYESTITTQNGEKRHYPGNASWTNLMERTEDGWKITKGANAAGSFEVVQEG